MKTLLIEGKNGDFTIDFHKGVNLKKMNQAERMEYWQRQGDNEIFNAAWEMIQRYCGANGIDPHIDRTVGFHSNNLSDMK